MNRRVFLAVTIAAGALGPRTARAAQPVELPMRVRNNRIFVDFGFPAAGGTSEPVMTQLDTGGGALVLASDYAKKLGYTENTAGAPKGYAVLHLDRITIGSQTIAVPRAAAPVKPMTVYNPGADSPAFFAVAVLRDHVVTFDYPGGRFALDGPMLSGATALPVQIAQKSAMPRIELDVDGERMGFLLDTGASFTMLSKTVIDRLRQKHPEWRYTVGAYGPANMIGTKLEANSEMLRIPGVRWGPFTIDALDVVSRPPDTFEKYMTAMMSAPIVGAIGGNVLRNFALRLDYPHSMLQARFAANPWPEELEIVPLILQPHANGSFTISGGITEGTQLSLDETRLLSVDGKPVDGLTLFTVQQMLRGTPGTPHVLRVQTATAPPNTVTLKTKTIL